MPKPKLSMSAVADLREYDKNSRTHTERQIDKIAKSIEQFGFLNPVIVAADGVIVAGHARVRAARKLGLQEVPTIDASHLSEEQRRAYVIADNRLSDEGGWDDRILREELLALRDENFDLGTLGFDDHQLTGYLKRLSEDEFKVPLDTPPAPIGPPPAMPSERAAERAAGGQAPAPAPQPVAGQTSAHSPPSSAPAAAPEEDETTFRKSHDGMSEFSLVMPLEQKRALVARIREHGKERGITGLVASLLDLVGVKQDG